MHVTTTSVGISTTSTKHGRGLEPLVLGMADFAKYLLPLYTYGVMLNEMLCASTLHRHSMDHA
jgi:hypothetical protein